LAVANLGDTLRSPAALSDAWHHIAVVRRFNGAVTLYLDGDNVASAAAGSHGKLVPSALHAGARQHGIMPADLDRYFTGKLDEIRCWSTALPLSAIRSRMRDAVYGYNHLYLHIPFESRGLENADGDSAYTYGLAENLFGYDFNFGFGNNDATSMEDAENGNPGATLLELSNAGTGGDIKYLVQGVDAPLMQSEPQVATSEPGDVSDISWNYLHDECIIDLDPASLWKFEDQVVTFSLPRNELRDEAGNTTGSDLVFEMLMDRNPLKWSSDEMSESALVDDEKVYTTTISNVGFQPETFEIVGAPAWMNISPASGQISGQDEVTITLSAPSFMNIGMYEFDLKLKGGLACGAANAAPPGYCYGERFTFSLDVYIDPPVLEVNEWAYQNVMPVVAKVYKFDVASSDPRDIAMAYIDGELRGYSELDLNVSGNYLGFISVFYNSGEEAKEVEFRVWDASTGIVRAKTTAHWPTLDTDPMTIVPLESGYGSLFEPLLLRATDDVESSTSVYPGWNWVSFNVTEEDGSMYDVQKAFSSLPASEIVNIKAHGIGSFNTNGVWTATGLPGAASTATQMDMRYMLEMNSTNQDLSWTLSNVGQAANPEVVQQDLVTGWNELGYIPQNEMLVNDALRSLADADTVLGDNAMIKSRYDGFALYAGDGEWMGSLNQLRPGQGYRLKLGTPGSTSWQNGDAAGTLEWPMSDNFYNPDWRAANHFNGTSEIDDTWHVDVQNLEASMSMVIRLELPSSQPQGLADVIGAFVTDDDGNQRCVGQVLPKDTDEGLLYFLSVYGDPVDPSTLSFRWSSGLNGAENVADEILEFEASSLHGRLSDPFILRFSKAGLGNTTQGQNNLVAYPSPFNDVLTIHWHGTLPITDLRVEDANGRLIEIIDCDGLLNGPCRWVATGLESGIYFIRAFTEEGQQIVRVIK
jgi:hypothetical protein